MSSTPQSKESTASTNATHPRSKRNSSDVGWEFGILADPNDPDKVQCLKCKKLVSGGVYRIKQHIAGIRGSVKACKLSSDEDKMKCRNALNEAKHKKKAKQEHNDALRAEVNISNDETIDLDEMEDSFGKLKPSKSFGPIDRFAKVVDKGTSKQTNLSNVIRKEQMIAYKEYICRWAYECAIPFHVFERDSFVKVMQAVGQFGPNGPPPTRYEIGDTFLKKEVQRIKCLMTKYKEEWERIGCSIMTDAWSDRKRRSIMNLCVNSKLGTVFIGAKDCSDNAHTSDYIFEYVDSCIEEVGPDNVVQIVTDNASNNMGAAKLLQEKRPKIFWTSCATHTINLMLEAIGGLTRYKKILDQAKTLTVFIYAHHKTLALMRQFTKKRDIVRPGVTRFASGFLTLQSLAEKKSQLRNMFCSEEWEKCKFSKTVKGKTVYALVLSAAFWAGVTTCLKVFAPLVKVLRMVDADWKPSMGFIYGELRKVTQEIKSALNDNENAYKPVLNIIAQKSSNRLDTILHKAAYILNPYYYYYYYPLAKLDVEANDSIVEILGVLFPRDYELQNHINMVELPMYKNKLEKFDRPIAIKACEVNNEKFDPANWWDSYGGSAPNLRKIAIRILSLTTISSGCERIWSIFEGVHTKKRNRLEVAKMNNLVYVQANANLMERNNKRKARNHEILLGEDASEAQEWIVDGDDAHWEAVSDALGVEDELRPRTSSRRKERELFEDDFVSESEEEVDAEVEYESDGVNIIEQYGEEEN